jgi:histidyl-tRNA synthetase
LSNIKTLKGVSDVLPPDVHVFEKIEDAARKIFRRYSFSELRIPIIEHTGLFTRSIGEATDIVEKEMYTFTDKGGRSISLRPEGTASVVRSYVENRLHDLPAPQKFYYMGPMFRYERPQKGRLRQFYQIGAEVFGGASASVDAELLVMIDSLLKDIRLHDTKLFINSIGCKVCRPGFRDALIKYFGLRVELLCEDCKKRLERNPLRILDCKMESCANLRKDAPKITTHLCAGCRTHHEELKGLLDALGVKYHEDPDIVRGLDYYTRTTFEVRTERLGAQNAVVAGGRYDDLVKEFGGPQTPAVGFALGVERVCELMKANFIGIAGGPEAYPEYCPEFYVIPLGIAAAQKALALAGGLRFLGRVVAVGDSAVSLKSQLKRADKSGARFAVIVGLDEVERGVAVWRRLSDGAQGEVMIDDAGALINLSKEQGGDAAHAAKAAKEFS